MIATIVSGGLSFLFVLFFTAIGTNLFKSRNIGQAIQEELNFHEHKKGTPTMGGVFIAAGTFFGFLLAHINFWTIGKGFKVEIDYIVPEVLSLLLFGTLMASVGFIDDFLKVQKGRNLGLSAKNKLLLQIIVASIISYFFYTLDLSTTFYLFSGFGIDIGVIKWFVIVLFIVGFTNAVNLTDGLDGLVAGTSTISFGGVLVMTFWIFRHQNYYTVFMNEAFLSLDLSILVSSIAGSCLGFLWWNTNPAKIIMGDVGSHFLGAMFPIIFFAIGADALIFFICMLYVLEALSVIIQVGSFKLRGTRVFKMAPLHHHFEMNNWAETTIIVRFWIVNGIFVVIALGLFYGDWVLFGN